VGGTDTASGSSPTRHAKQQTRARTLHTSPLLFTNLSLRKKGKKQSQKLPKKVFGGGIERNNDNTRQRGWGHCTRKAPTRHEQILHLLFTHLPLPPSPPTPARSTTAGAFGAFAQPHAGAATMPIAPTAVHVGGLAAGGGGMAGAEVGGCTGLYSCGVQLTRSV
jgi:hypothetical protein